VGSAFLMYSNCEYLALIVSAWSPIAACSPLIDAY
jgi:hypothetical protein